jgi:hypothetical protein
MLSHQPNYLSLEDAMAKRDQKLRRYISPSVEDESHLDVYDGGEI